MQDIQTHITLLLCVVAFALATPGCKRPATPQPRKVSPNVRAKAAPKAPTFSHRWFATPKQAFLRVLKTKPDILGVGEVHQVQAQRHIPSAIKRFRQHLLTSLWGKASDLIVETWVTTGRCGASEVKVAKRVQKITKRPKKTENHIVSLLKAAKHIGIQPHILRVHCKTYQELLKHKGADQARQLILLITRLLLQKTRAVYHHRRKQKQKGIVVLYGGALHNDLNPTPSLAHYSYVPKLQEELKKQAPRFVELDLYVPEYLLDDQEWRQRPWFKLYQQQSNTKKTLLIQRNPRSFILLLPWTTHAKPNTLLKRKPPKQRKKQKKRKQRKQRKKRKKRKQ